MFKTGNENNNNRMVNFTTDYVHFCMDTVILEKDGRFLTNKKCWINNRVMNLLNQRRDAFRDLNYYH